MCEAVRENGSHQLGKEGTILEIPVFGVDYVRILWARSLIGLS